MAWGQHGLLMVGHSTNSILIHFLQIIKILNWQITNCQTNVDCFTRYIYTIH